MSITNLELKTYLDGLLRVNEISDYCPNGLQVEGKGNIQKVVTGVTASQALIDKAIDVNADAILVHHGYFWKGETQAITGMKKKRIAALLANDINLYGYHLPLDVHPEYGNNRQLGDLLHVENIRAATQIKPVGVVMLGELAEPMSASSLQEKLQQLLGRQVLVETTEGSTLKSIAWCTGGGQGFIESAVELGVDGFITGEVSEQTIHTAREMNISFFAAGHHATERYGIKALGEHIKEHFAIDVEFIDIPNPA
ncbi:GTP cyclohydrolase 1 type 2 [Alteromonas sp. KUL42]|uniref:Nif3-like dinuclear metal center hexameric protein n=1 Tax=Alteromonas sp. KUL42 TaxID=2480797 RepID=UPI0007937660|nr:Nif3-like dinuclear metal center hexameric protein [Alteromonas sp. KUL42]KXJ60488.1 MAG: metal-binding protein [Alteromonas sp. Nap_26]TAP36568.1 Nif3-like dinuclear metal center hexameric protein [Alteromonas sp. KUL42]GEA06769.1 GTP cyclohydrolase 1 type 2 [Alteromonas sp. KUL42]